MKKVSTKQSRQWGKYEIYLAFIAHHSDAFIVDFEQSLILH